MKHSPLHLFAVTVLAAERSPEEADQIIRLAWDQAVEADCELSQKLLREYFAQYLPAAEALPTYH